MKQQEKEIASCQFQACTSESSRKQGIIVTLLSVNSVLENIKSLGFSYKLVIYSISEKENPFGEQIKEYHLVFFGY